MKVLSLLQPWASLVVLGHKKIETRSWNTKYRGELLIHASKGKSKLGNELFMSKIAKDATGWYFHDYKCLPFGAIIGKVNLVDTFTTEEAIHRMSYIEYFKNHPKEQEMAFGDYSPSRFGWLLSDPVVFNVPIPAKGMLGLWEFDYESRIKAAEELERDGYL